MFPGRDGRPDPATRTTFMGGHPNRFWGAGPVDLQIGPGGDIFYADHGRGTIRRIRYLAPTAVIAADKTSGPVPLTVAFDATGSTDPEASRLAYEWDLDGDGAYDDSSEPKPTYTYTNAGDYAVRLRVTNARGVSATDSLLIAAGTTPPRVTIASPTTTTRWRVGDSIPFSGSGTDEQEGALPGSAFTWSLVLHHCPAECHPHTLTELTGVSSGSFLAPDHEYLSYIEIKLTVRDSRGLASTTSVRLEPETTTLTLRSQPTGLQVSAGSTLARTPLTTTVIIARDTR